MIKRAALLTALLAGSANAEVPIALAATGHATVPVAGTFGTRQFVFDTGAEGSAVYAGFADEVALPTIASETLQGQTGATQVSLVRLERLVLDGVTKGPIEALRLEPRADGVALAGIVGLDLFGDRTIDFDYATRRLDLLEPGVRPAGLNGPGVPATPTTGKLLTVPVRIGRVEAVAVIDTGARKTRINWKLGRALGLIIKGWKADESGNLMFRKTARNFNLPAATCGKICVAEVEEIVPVGSLDPDCIHLPSIYVNRLILGAPYDKKIEFRTVREREAA